VSALAGVQRVCERMERMVNCVLCVELRLSLRWPVYSVSVCLSLLAAWVATLADCIGNELRYISACVRGFCNIDICCTTLSDNSVICICVTLQSSDE